MRALALVLLASACGGGSSGAADASAPGDGDGDGDGAPPRDMRPPGSGGALYFGPSESGAYDHAVLDDLPAPFGEAELTVELVVQLDSSFPVGSTASGDDQRTNWFDGDPAPYSRDDWWYAGNFLLDGHNNGSYRNGTFSLQLYAGGALRWLVGDGSDAGPGGLWAIQVHPAAASDSLLDGAAHDVALVRRWSGASGARYELWIDGTLRASEDSPVRTNLRQWWSTWADFPSQQEGWFWGAEKQAAIGSLAQWEDYKGLLADVRLWSRALTPQEIASPGPDGTTDLVARFQFGEGGGMSTCADATMPCMTLVGVDASAWRTAP